jgi:predicted transcriptional regulator YdeE
MIGLELGEVIRKRLPEFAVIGKEGRGLATEAASWVPELWELANRDFEELAEAANEWEVDSVNLWGLMSDANRWLDPWQEEGRYLAGMQLPHEVKQPHDWQRWLIPAMEYLVVKTNEANLEMMTEKMFEEILPQENAELVAAIQEHYLPNFEPGEVELYFPIKML